MGPPVIDAPFVEALVLLNANEKLARNTSHPRGMEDGDPPLQLQQNKQPQPHTSQQHYQQQRQRPFNSNSGGAFTHHRGGGEGFEHESGPGLESFDRHALGSRGNFRVGGARRSDHLPGGEEGPNRILSGGGSGGGSGDRPSTTPMSRVTARSGGIGGPGSRGSGKKPSGTSTPSE